MAESFDAGAFVTAGSITVSATTFPLLVAPCDLDLTSIQISNTAPTTTGASFNVKITPPTRQAVYARTYNYNYATAKNVQVSSATTNGTALTTYTTATEHGLSAGDVVTVTGLSANWWNVKDRVVASGSGTTFTIADVTVAATNIHPTGKVALTSHTPAAGATGNLVYTTAVNHNFKVGDKVTISGTTSGTMDLTLATIKTISSATTFEVANSATAAATGASGIVLLTCVASTTAPAVVTKGVVVDAVQLVTDATDYNKAPDYTAGTAYYAYTSDLYIPLLATGSNYGTATNLGNADARIGNKIPQGSIVELEIFSVGGATFTGTTLKYGVEFKKK